MGIPIKKIENKTFLSFLKTFRSKIEVSEQSLLLVSFQYQIFLTPVII